MNLGKLTDTGVDLFADYLVQARRGDVVDPPRQLLSDPSCSTVLCDESELDPEREFPTRLEAAKYLDGVLARLPPGEDRDVGMWAWLSLLYFNQVCPLGPGGRRKIGEQARYIPAPNAFQRFYRHLLLGPLLIYRAHRECPAAAGSVLASPVSSPGDIVEQLASRQELVSNPTVMGVATTLYVDVQGALKRGAGGKGAGSPRRLVDIVNQYDLTYDLYAMSSEDLHALLPSEFDRFKA